MAYFPTSKWLLDYLPDFCWQHADEILWMIEQDNPLAESNCICVTLIHLVQKGRILRRRSPHRSVGPHGIVYQYKAHDRHPLKSSFRKNSARDINLEIHSPDHGESP